jgi:hypothetical protein
MIKYFIYYCADLLMEYPYVRAPVANHISGLDFSVFIMK